jgi:transcriptional regulator with XRE-family HTH domain
MPQRPTKALVKAREEPPGLRLQRVFAENFRAARMEAELSQKDISELSGLAQQTISQIETARHNLTLKTMDKLGKVVGREVHDLLSPKPSRTANRDSQ